MTELDIIRDLIARQGLRYQVVAMPDLTQLIVRHGRQRDEHPLSIVPVVFEFDGAGAFRNVRSE